MTGGIGLVIPTRWEADPIISHFKMQRVQTNLVHVKKAGHDIWARLSGVGREKARRAADQLCVDHHVKMLVSVGFCGALTPQLKVGDIIRDRIATVDLPAKTPAERQAITQKANALAVDMETQAIIEAGTLRGVPIRVLRVVSDRFDDDLTPLFGTSGEFSIPKMMLRLLNPGLWPLAARLRQQSHVASQQLIAALEMWFENPD